MKESIDPIWDRNEPNHTEGSVSGRMVIVGIVAFIGLGLWLRLGMGPDQKNLAAQATCRQHLQIIGQYIQQFANTHSGKLPDQLSDLHELTPNELWCPRGMGMIMMEARRGSTQPFTAPDTDYTYWGKGLTTATSPDTILLTESTSNHVEGMNVLYADGLAEFVPESAARRLIESLKNKQNPPIKSSRTK